MAEFLRISAGDPAPSFTQRSAGNPRYAFDTAAGRYIVLCFFHSVAAPGTPERLSAVLNRPELFDDIHACAFALSTDPEDETLARVANRIPGFRVIWDMDMSVSRLYGAANSAGDRRGLWVVTDPTLRIIDVVAFEPDGGDIPRLVGLLAGLSPPDCFAGIPLQAPILYLPRVFEPSLCRHLVELYEDKGGEESGFMREINGRTVGVSDKRHKSRRDVILEDQRLVAAVQNRIVRRVVPEIAKVHQFHVTRMERYIVSCYAAEHGGHFAPHRDNTTSGTAHRRFAVSVNLNDGFEGGEVSFPEYGPRGFKAPPGGAVVFSCSLLHRVSPVTQGKRYAFLPFLYDEAAAKIRTANLHRIESVRSESTPPENSASAS